MSLTEHVTPSPPPDPAPSEAAETPSGDRSRASLVRIGLAATILIFYTCAALLVWRGLTVNVPDAVLITRANPAWEGAVASVDGVNLVKLDPSRQQSGTFDKNSKYTISFHLVPGEYTLRVRREGALLYEHDFHLSRREKIGVLYLPREPEQAPPSTTRPGFPSSPFGFDPRWPGT